jgi:hypothetical protein
MNAPSFFGVTMMRIAGHKKGHLIEACACKRINLSVRASLGNRSR